MKTELHYFFKRMLFAWALFTPFASFGLTEIRTEAELRAIANDLSGEYKLINDITLTGEWTPIGNEENRFTGVLDGNGKTIKGLKFSDKERDGVGFIGVAEGAIITNLSLVNAQIYGQQDVGGIVGRAYAPVTIEKCYTSGVFSGKDHIGGIAGGTKGSNSGDKTLIQNCFSSAVINSTSWQAGGILGTAVDVDVKNNLFLGVAQCPSGRTAGIVALADGGETLIEKNVSGAGFLKGDETYRILGSANGYSVTLNDNFSWEETQVYVKGNIFQEGISDPDDRDGEHKTSAELQTSSFYTGTLSWNPVNWNFDANKYPILSYQTYPLEGDAIYYNDLPERALPGNTFDLEAVSSINRPIMYNSSAPAVATVDNSGQLSFLTNGKTIITLTTTGNSFFTGATISFELEVKGISYTIATEEDLKNIKYDLEGEFTLANNITLTAAWEPINGFKGKLDGNGKIIYGLKIDDRNNRNRGLFSETEDAEIIRLGIEQAYIVGNEDIGAIVGNMKGGLIDQCYVTDSYIAGRDHIGSLVGAMRPYEFVSDPGDPENGIPETREKKYSIVRNCHAGASVYSREFQAGGIVGIICGGTLEKSYFSGLVQAQKGRAAGLVSLVDSDDPGEIKNNINLTVAGYCSENTFRIGDWGSRGFGTGNYVVNFTNNWSIEESYFGSDLKNSAVKSNYTENDDRDGRNLSNENNAKTQSFYTGTLGWDFNNTWKFITGTEGKMYPVLKWQNAPLVSPVFGIPEPAYLTWYQGSMEAIELNKIRATYGQALTFNPISGANFVELIDDLLYVTEAPITAGGYTKVAINMEAALASVITLKKNDFDIEIILRDAYNDISTPADLIAINNKLFARFRLTRNINMSEIDFEGIGSIDTPFTGELNGNGFSILNPVVKTNGENVKGLFNATNGARIQKLGVLNFSLSGAKGVDFGALVGVAKNNTIIEECYVTGTVAGNDHVGGFIGGQADNVTIKNSYVNINVSADMQAGGFIGATGGSVTVENSYFAGNVTAGSGWSGGIIGLIDKAGTIRISNTVSIGDVSNGERAGAHIGGNIEDNGVPRGTVSLFLNNLHNLDAIINTNGSEWNASALEVPGSIQSSTAKLPEDMKRQATYTAISWDFGTVWTIQEGVNYPCLRNVQQATKLPEYEINKNKYQVYTSGNTIYISGIEKDVLVTLYNANGQWISQSKIKNNGAVQAPTKGLYLLKISENENSYPVKVICR